MSSFKEQAHALLASLGIKIGGDKPWDVTVLNENIYNRVLEDGTLGIGEGYMAGEWECQALDQLTEKALKGDLTGDLTKMFSKKVKLFFFLLSHKIFNFGNKSKAFEIGEHHYNLGNDLFSLMLDKQMVYSCGYWKNATNLDTAQEDKLDLICRKIGLKKGMKVLDIGGGWGGFDRYACKNYGVSVVNVTVSKEQVKFAEKLGKGLPIKNFLLDYRDIKGRFDRVISVGMFEHVGEKNYRLFMEVVTKNLKDDGLFLLHTIGQDPPGQDDAILWVNKYIFPNSKLPIAEEIIKASQGLFIMEDWHNFSADYDKTLMSWYQNFEQNWPKIAQKYGEKFYRMWKFWLLTSAGSFRARKLQLWQIVFSKNGVRGGYESVR